MAKRLLILEDGTIFEGQAFGADVDVTGEIVFNTGMTGYQESITDQSYNGQILTFTYPLVGNYGVNRDAYESIKPTTKGVVVSEASRRASNWRNQMTLDEFTTNFRASTTNFRASTTNFRKKRPIFLRKF